MIYSPDAQSPEFQITRCIPGDSLPCHSCGNPEGGLCPRNPATPPCYAGGNKGGDTFKLCNFQTTSTTPSWLTSLQSRFPFVQSIFLKRPESPRKIDRTRRRYGYRHSGNGLLRSLLGIPAPYILSIGHYGNR
jgi:hypothetical protein